MNQSSLTNRTNRLAYFSSPVRRCQAWASIVTILDGCLNFIKSITRSFTCFTLWEDDSPGSTSLNSSIYVPSEETGNLTATRRFPRRAGSCAVIAWYCYPSGCFLAIARIWVGGFAGRRVLRGTGRPGFIWAGAFVLIAVGCGDDPGGRAMGTGPMGNVRTYSESLCRRGGVLPKRGSLQPCHIALEKS